MEKNIEKVNASLAGIGPFTIKVLFFGAVVIFAYFKGPFTADFLPLLLLYFFVLAVDLLISPGVLIVGIVDSALNLQMSEAHIFSSALTILPIVLSILVVFVVFFNKKEKPTNKALTLKALKVYGVIIISALISISAINSFFDTHIPIEGFNNYLKLEEKYGAPWEKIK